MENKGFADDAGVTNSTVADETQSQVHLADLDKTNDGTINGQEGVSESPVDKSSIPKPKENEKESTALFLPININEKDVDGQIQANGHTLYSPSTNKDEGDGNGDDDDGNEDDDDDLVCGVGSVTPGCLQRFMNIGYFTAFYSLAGLMTSALNVYISSQITTLEKYYNFSSSVSGFLMSCNDIGYLLTALLMSYYSRRVHIPRALSLSTFIFGVSGIMCVLAFVLTKDQYSSMTKFSSSHDNTTSARANQNSVANLCRNVTAASNISSQGDVPDAGGMSDGWKAFALSILAVGLCIQGVAKSPRHAFLGTYIDDNVPKTKTAKYLGIVGGLSIFGPAMAFMLGGIFSKIYVTLEDPGISVRDPRWVGAWWLGFLFFGGAAVVVAIPIFCFPRHLKGRRQIEGAEPQKKGVAEDEKKTTVVADDLKAFLQSGRRLLANPVYVLVVLATGINMTGIAGYTAFAAKYFETQFMVSVFQANTTLGSLNVLSAALGTVLGGFLVSRRKMSPKTCIKFNLACTSISLLSMSLCFFLGCDQPHIHPMDDTLVGENGAMSMLECAAGCNCDTQNFFPVCGADNRNYFSPCHAGCTDVLESNVFVNCSCVFSDPAVVGTVAPASSNQTASAGLCPPDCHNFFPYAFSMFFMAFFATLTIMPNFVIYVRSVSEVDKPLAIGFMAFSTTVLGWLPGPVLYGILVDSCCKIWTSAGACSLYNLPHFRFRFHFLLLICRGSSMALFIIVFLIVTFSKTFEFQSHTDEIEEAASLAPSKEKLENGKVSTCEHDEKRKEIETNWKL